MKALTMSELRKKGEVPLSPKDRHSQNIGTGNYNRFAPLLPPPSGRSRLNSKRKLDDSSPPITPKTPRLDANVVFAQLKSSEDIVSEVRTALSEALKAGESCYSANDGGMGEAFFKLSKTVDFLISNQEKILSTVVDAIGVLGKDNGPVSYASAAAGKGKRLPHDHPPRDTAVVDPTEQKVKKLRQAIAKAERSVTLFDLDLGSVPVLNRDILSRKVTLLLHDRAQREGIYKGNPPAAEEAMDDILSCASIDILGKGSRPFYNKKDNNDARNCKMCTVPIKLTFKDKKTRFQAELSLKKICKVKCATPYPKGIRVLMDNLVKECKDENPGCFILAKVDVEKLTVTAKARSDEGWVDLNNSTPIPHDILDPAELAAVGEDEVIEMVTIS
jgi:hypothetical protein